MKNVCASRDIDKKKRFCLFFVLEFEQNQWRTWTYDRCNTPYAGSLIVSRKVKVLSYFEQQQQKQLLQPWNITLITLAIFSWHMCVSKCDVRGYGTSCVRFDVAAYANPFEQRVTYRWHVVESFWPCGRSQYNWNSFRLLTRDDTGVWALIFLQIFKHHFPACAQMCNWSAEISHEIFAPRFVFLTEHIRFGNEINLLVDSLSYQSILGLTTILSLPKCKQNNKSVQTNNKNLAYFLFVELLSFL